MITFRDEKARHKEIEKVEADAQKEVAKRRKSFDKQLTGLEGKTKAHVTDWKHN